MNDNIESNHVGFAFPRETISNEEAFDECSEVVSSFCEAMAQTALINDVAKLIRKTHTVHGDWVRPRYIRYTLVNHTNYADFVIVYSTNELYSAYDMFVEFYFAKADVPTHVRIAWSDHDGNVNKCEFSDIASISNDFIAYLRSDAREWEG